MSRMDFSSFRQVMQRFETAMTGVPVRVPLFAQLYEFAMKEIGEAAGEFYKKYAEENCMPLILWTQIFTMLSCTAVKTGKLPL